MKAFTAALVFAIALWPGAGIAENAIVTEPPSKTEEATQAIKEGAHKVGGATRDAARAIGHGARDVTKAIGHGARDAVHEVGDGAKKAWNGVTE